MRQRFTGFSALGAIGCAMSIQIISATPAGAWPVHGVAVCSEPHGQFSPVLVTDGNAGAIVVWWDQRGDTGVYAQRVDSTGTPLWTANGVTVCDIAGTQFVPHAVPDAVGGAIIVWADRRSGDYDLYAQRINANGAALWTPNGVALCTATGSQAAAALVTDRSSPVLGPIGAIVAWGDPRVATNDYNISVQHVGGTGGDLWAVNGRALCTAPGNQSGAAIATDGAGVVIAQHGAIVTWTDSRSGEADVYAGRVDAAGNPLWANDGVAVCALPGAQLEPKITYVGAAVVIVWQDAGRNGLYGQKLDVNGNALWAANGILVTGTPSDEMLFAVAGNGAGGIVVAWEDARNDGSDIYAQSFDTNGAPLWTAGGVAVINAPSTQLVPTVVPDNSGGAIVAWVDWRSGFSAAIYAQHVNGSGQVVWPAEGVRLSNVSFAYEPTSVGNGQNQAIVAWEDMRNGNDDIYANRVYDPKSVDAPLGLDSSFGITLRAPNPVAGAASLRLELPRASSVVAQIFDPRGRLVRVLVEPTRFPSGSHVLSWDGKDDVGLAAPPGVYFVRVRAGEQSSTLKLVELR